MKNKMRACEMFPMFAIVISSTCAAVWQPQDVVRRSLGDGRIARRARCGDPFPSQPSPTPAALRLPPGESAKQTQLAGSGAVREGLFCKTNPICVAVVLSARHFYQMPRSETRVLVGQKNKANLARAQGEPGKHEIRSSKSETNSKSPNSSDRNRARNAKPSQLPRIQPDLGSSNHEMRNAKQTQFLRSWAENEVRRKIQSQFGVATGVDASGAGPMALGRRTEAARMDRRSVL